jgi:hypothetical protein
MLSSPVFCLTADVDWASEAALAPLLDLSARYGITPTIFATHPSPLLADTERRGCVEIGIHPNFLPGSSHGNDLESVLDHLCGLFPGATSFRAHRMVDSPLITQAMRRRGFTHDSNLCLYLQSHIMPLRLSTDLVRFPIFWGDDNHWLHTDDWNVDHFLADFLTPGLKVINVHPFLVAANVPSEEGYQAVRHRMAHCTSADLAALRFAGDGAGTFLERLLEMLVARGERFASLGELFRDFPPPTPRAFADPEPRRTTDHTEEDHAHYWNLSESERQSFMRRSYEQRSATDPYATSRDFHLRELEIDSIRQHLVRPGRVLDLGCGNGHTLLSLARTLDGWDMTGVDFSPHLIDGAQTLLERDQAHLQSSPLFICDDAIAFVAAE